MNSILGLGRAALITLCLTMRGQGAAPEAASPQGDATNLPPVNAAANRPERDVMDRIRDEGLSHSQVMETLGYLTDVIGPRLTGSGSCKRANEWTRDQLACYGLTNAHLEAWGPFGRGWRLEGFSAQLTEPQVAPLRAYPNAWSPGLDQPLTARVVYLDAKTEADLDNYRGKLKGAIVLASQPRELRPPFEPLAARLAETNLLPLANAGEPRSATRRGSPSLFQRVQTIASAGSTSGTSGEQGPAGATNSPAPDSASQPGRPPRGRGGLQSRTLAFLEKEGAALVVNESFLGDGGEVFVAAATVPVPGLREGRATNIVRAWFTNAPAVPPQMTMAADDYNRLVRLARRGEKLEMRVDMRAEFENGDPMAYNTVAEIPGSDLKDEIVMLGAHLDSWHAGTGATDNGAGVAAVMEAVRILEALHLKPRRTVRVGLWTGEEQGLFGSKAYVTRHFGYYTNRAETAGLRSPKEGAGAAPPRTSPDPARRLVRGKEYERLSAYFNLDNGGGKIRGVYLQGNEAVRKLFRHWLEPFSDLGAETLTLRNTSGTDHLSFDAIGLPGFQFIQDPMDYSTRTHHSNLDVFDRVQPDDLKQASVILAAFAYNAAMMDERMPRKPAE